VGERTITIAIEDRAERVADVEALVVEPGGAGPSVRLGDVASVLLTYAEPREVHRLDGASAVALYLHRLPGTNAIEVVDRVRERLARLETKLPTGIRVIEDYDGSEQIRRELDELRDRSLLSTACVLLVLLLAFGRWRPALLVVATIAACVLVTLALMAMTGLSLNLLTLAGLAMGVGLIDDNAIVVLESIEARQGGHAGGPQVASRAAARAGARWVVAPVLAASLTNLIVFVPFLYLQGELRAYYLPFAMTVGLALLASLAAAFTLIPALAARTGGRAAPEVSFRPRFARSRHRIRPRDLYQDAIVWTVHHPRRTVGSVLLVLAGSGWLFWEEVPRGRTWAGLEEESFLTVQVTMPPGAGLERTDEVARRIEARLGGIPAVDRYDTRVGPGYAWVQVAFPDSLATTSAPVAVKEELIALSRTIGGASVRVHGFGPGFQGAGGATPGYGLELRGHDYRELERVTEDLAERLERFPRIRDVDPDAAGHWFERERETELVLVPDRGRLAAYGISAAGLLRRVGSYTGAAAIHETVALAGEDADLSLEIEGAAEADVRALLDLPLAEGGSPVRVADVAGVHERTTMGRIVRDDQQYLRTVTWEFRGPRKLGDRTRDAVIAATALPAGYGLLAERSFWEYEEGEKMELALVVTLAVALVYMVTAALFESLKAPLVVLAAVPLAMIGIFLLYFLLDETFTREAWIGVVMMAGIVVNNTILVVDRIGALRRGADGPPLPLEEAAVRGAMERVRPILMTTGTTVLGLLPLVLFTEPGTASLWTALALATIGGLASSTILVLTTIPALYVVVRPRTVRKTPGY
jgi:HAE1 family hydrophobic/amphiphilic exporter-1